MNEQSSTVDETLVTQPAAEAQRPDAPEVVPGELIIKYREGMAQQSAQLAGLSLSAVRALSGGETLVRVSGGGLGAQSILSAQATLDAVERLREQAGDAIEYVQPNYIYRALAVPNDPYYSLQWHYPAMNLPAAWDITTGANSPVVAVIDTGQLNHPDLAGRFVAGYDFISNTSTAGDGNGRDSDPTDVGDAAVCNGQQQPNSWHGTHVAGTIGAATNNGVGVAGVNWNARIQHARVLGKCGGSTADIIDAIRWTSGMTVSGVPANATPAKVINMSLGGYLGSSCAASDPATQAAINDAVARGVTVVVAAGNSNDNAGLYTPASCNNTVTVAATETRNYRAPYSNYGSAIDVAAPGGDTSADRNGDGYADGVLSTLRDASGTAYNYAFYQGTSMATPHVAGVVSLMYAVRPGITPAQVLSTLQSTAKPLSSTQCAQGCGSGLVDAYAAVNAAKNGGTTSPQPVSDDTAQGAITLTKAASKSGSVSSSDTQDWYKFTATGGSVTVRLATGSDADLYLYDSNALTQLGASERGGSQTESISRTLTAGKTYYAAVVRYSGSPNYTVSVSGAAQ
ncbi:serine protease [Deinobacterium chartae]|uniref:Serine protease n=1 Tax=Deinobacterium chartae TaxID=521158 RepID=A0A841HZT7_9DEIO|nr:S8 family serine peptidase [Deinobacterium chartae]MBB6097518.1 serine protease [Deinobacterium chartae]